ncbi:apolipoprotein L4-like [Littorina saxatilis]|uniref:Uncharacterized protein n=1 Tax=Littorina saxatilis TaxID=31220 RepID=A0AAN9BIS8_9CAEN
MEELANDAAKLRDKFRLLADELDKRYDEAKITELVGCVVETTGEVASIVGTILAPFTVGESLFITEFGAGLAAFGNATSLSAEAGDKLAERNTAEDVHKMWDDFRAKFSGLIDPDLSDEDIIGDAGAIFGTDLPTKATVKIMSIINSVREGAHAGHLRAEAREAGEIAAGTVAKAVALNVVSLGFSVYELVEIAVEVHEHTKSKLGVAIRNLAQELDKIAQLSTSPSSRFDV